MWALGKGHSDVPTHWTVCASPCECTEWGAPAALEVGEDDTGSVLLKDVLEVARKKGGNKSISGNSINLME